MLTRKILNLSLIGADWVNWLLLAISLVGTAVLLDRLLLYVRTRERYGGLRAALTENLRRGDHRAALAAVRGDTLVRNVLRAGLEAMARGERRPDAVEQTMLGALADQRARYEDRLGALTTIGNVSPLLGLLGTVIGIVQAFYVLGRLDTVQATGNAEIMRAIGEALTTTGAGILVAVPAVVSFNVLRAHVAKRLKQSESLMREVVAHVPSGAAEGA
ncbi:MAG TPA: MotA/TolQ/ExbB proton channel family protein [Anaeromyxobacteraceae bacterium]|nr:MotA/TolQ/ExbB proton channel family protein [Anaeromyxobacteraceae bacterium]